MQIMPGTFAEIGFNPCSAGFRSETLGGLAESIFHSRVSILVLLDSALRLRIRGRVRLPCAVFQSLFCWIPL